MRKGAELEASSVTVITDFEENAANGETFVNLTAELLLNAVRDTDSNVFGNITSATLDTAAATDDLFGIRRHIVMIENDQDINSGEYKIFELRDDNEDSGDFTSASLLGTLDFGETQNFSADNFLA